MNLSTKVTMKDYYISALTIVKTNLDDLKSHKTKAQPENWFTRLHIKPNLIDTKVT